MGDLPSHLPFRRLPSLPLNVTTLRAVLPAALALSVLGLLKLSFKFFCD